MTRALVLLALVGCGGGASSMRLPVFTPALDSTQVYDETTTTETQVHDMTTSVKLHRRWHRKVVALEGTLVTRIAVTYDLDDTSVYDGVNTTTTAGPLAGKGYVLWRDRDALEAEHADGSAITAEERAYFNGEFYQLGKTSRAEALVTGRSWRRGEAVAIDQDVIAEIGIPDGADVEVATLTWTGTTGDVVVLHASFSVTTEDGFDIQQTSDGQFERKTGREVRSETKSFIHGTYEGSPIVQTITSVKTIEAE